LGFIRDRFTMMEKTHSTRASFIDSKASQGNGFVEKEILSLGEEKKKGGPLLGNSSTRNKRKKTLWGAAWVIGCDIRKEKHRTSEKWKRFM